MPLLCGVRHIDATSTILEARQINSVVQIDQARNGTGSTTVTVFQQSAAELWVMVALSNGSTASAACRSSTQVRTSWWQAGSWQLRPANEAPIISAHQIAAAAESWRRAAWWLLFSGSDACAQDDHSAAGGRRAHADARRSHQTASPLR